MESSRTAICFVMMLVCGCDASLTRRDESPDGGCKPEPRKMYPEMGMTRIVPVSLFMSCTWGQYMNGAPPASDKLRTITIMNNELLPASNPAFPNRDFANLILEEEVSCVADVTNTKDLFGAWPIGFSSLLVRQKLEVIFNPMRQGIVQGSIRLIPKTDTNNVKTIFSFYQENRDREMEKILVQDQFDWPKKSDLVTLDDLAIRITMRYTGTGSASWTISNFQVEAHYLPILSSECKP